MKELDQQLAELVRKGIEVAEKTGEFVIEQAPDLLQEFYRWHMAKNIMTVFIGLFIAFSVWRIFRAIGRKEATKSPGYYSDETNIFGRWYDEIGGYLIFLFGVLGVGGTAVGFSINSIYNIVFITISPKLYLIEYFLN